MLNILCLHFIITEIHIGYTSSWLISIYNQIFKNIESYGKKNVPGHEKRISAVKNNSCQNNSNINIKKKSI